MICCSEHDGKEVLFLVVVEVVSPLRPAEDSWHEDDLNDSLEQAVNDEEDAPKPVLELVFIDFRVQEILCIAVPVGEEGSKEADSDQILEDSSHELTVKERNHEPAHAHGHEKCLNSSEPAPVERDIIEVLKEPVGRDDSVAHQ